MSTYYIEASVDAFNQYNTIWNKFSRHCWNIALLIVEPNTDYGTSEELIDYYKNLHAKVVNRELRQYNAVYDAAIEKIMFNNNEQLTEFKLKWIP